MTHWPSARFIRIHDSTIADHGRSPVPGHQLPVGGAPEYLAFTPTAAGPHTLTLRLLTADIPAIHVRIAEPLKTDGQRMPGY